MLAVIGTGRPPHTANSAGRSPRGIKSCRWPTLGRLLPLTGINWVKFPLWVAEPARQRLDQIVNFAERLSSQRIEMVGLLTNPPADVRADFGADATLAAADIFTADQQRSGMRRSSRC